VNRSRWSELVSDNPMLIEITRFRRRFLSFSGSSQVNNGVLALTLVCYAGLVLIVFNGRGEIPPIALVIFQAGVLALFAPAMMHGAIAGERERRSWDLLLVAPISKSQLVIGKFIGALAAMGVAVALCFFPILIAAVTYNNTNWWDLVLAEGVSIAFATLVCALTLFYSSRTSRSFTALGGALGTLGVTLILVPVILSVILQADPKLLAFTTLIQPFYALAELYSSSERYSYRPIEALVPRVWWGVPQIAVYFLLSLVLLALTVHGLNDADQAPATPGGRNDA